MVEVAVEGKIGGIKRGCLNAALRYFDGAEGGTRTPMDFLAYSNSPAATNISFPAKARAATGDGIPPRQGGWRTGRKDRRSNQSRLPDPHCKRMTTPISANPRRIFASGSVMDVPVEITPTITPAIEINHRIMRSPPPHFSRLGCRPTIRTSTLNANFAPLHIHWNILEYIRNRSAFPRRERRTCKGNTTLYEYDIHTCFAR